MIALPLSEIATITGGTLHGVTADAAGSLLVDGAVVTDSREAGPGSLYIARIGASMDGHAFVGDAARRGAVAALVTRPVEALPCVVVPDDQAAFAALARAVVDRSPQLTVIGVTGSSGKTSTKDLLGQVLAGLGETVAPVGSLNSEVGVPLTVCRITPGTRFLVAEMGARGIGHVAYLTGIAPPSIGIVLNVGSAHLGEFGSRAAIAAAKAELVEALPAGGLAVLNADDDVVRAMADRTVADVVLVGESADSDIRASEVSLDAGGRARFVVTAPGGRAAAQLALVGRHHVANALAVLAVALRLGMPLDRAVRAVGAAGAVSRYRMEIGERADGVTIVNDAYNANPESMRAALDAVAAMKGERRVWAVLGPMLELGEDARAAHEETGELVAARGVDILVVVGDEARGIATGARAAKRAIEVEEAPDRDAAYALVEHRLRSGDLVLVKSSNGAGLRFLGDALLASPTVAKEALP